MGLAVQRVHWLAVAAAIAALGLAALIIVVLSRRPHASYSHGHSPAAAAALAALAAAPASECGVRTGYRLEGSDLALPPGAAACCERCRALAGCRAWAYRAAGLGAGACELKDRTAVFAQPIEAAPSAVTTSVTTSVPAAAAASPALAAGACSCDAGTDREGNDLGAAAVQMSAGAAGRDACCALCSRLAPCRAWVFVRATDECWLKAAAGAARAAACCDSGPLPAQRHAAAVRAKRLVVAVPTVPRAVD